MKIKRICNCGAEFYGSPKRLRCDECQRQYQNARQRKYQREYAMAKKTGTFKPKYKSKNDVILTMKRYTGKYERWKKEILGM